MNGRKVGFDWYFCEFFPISLVYVLVLFTELPGVMPERVVGLTVSQIVASQRAAVRMERNLDLAKDRKLSKKNQS